MKRSILIWVTLWMSGLVLGANNSLESKFELATDELIRVSENGGVFKPDLPLPRDLDGLTKRLRERASKGMDSDRLVFYEKSKQRRESTRRALLPLIAVELSAGADPAQLAESLNADYRGTMDLGANIHLYEIRDYATIMNAIRGVSSMVGVVSAWPQLGRIHSKHLVPNDTYFEEQWHLHNDDTEGVDINAPAAWGSVTGSGIRIGIVDDGVQLTHPDLLDNIGADFHYDFIDDDDDPNPDLLVPDEDDGYPSGEDSHGTLVAGVAAAKGNNGIGSSGVAPDATIVGMRLIGGYTSDVMEAQAFLHEMDNVQVKNNSWGPPGFGDVYSGPSSLAKAALEQATREGRQGRGTVFVWASGNGGEKEDNSNKDGYSNSPFTIAVGAVNELGVQSYYGENGSNILISAPSGGRSTRGLISTDLLDNDGNNNESRSQELEVRNYSQEFSGTSGASPIVAGVTALMLEANPDLGWRDVQEILMSTAQKIDSEDFDWFENAANPPLSFNRKYGAGLVDASAAVDAAQSWTNLGPRRELSKGPSESLPVVVVDGPDGSVSLSFFVSSSDLRMEHAQVRLFISHEWRGDLELELESPNGTVSQLLADTVYDEELDIDDFTFMSVHFWGEDGDGVWKLHVKDHVSDFGGQIQQATLILSGSETSGSDIPSKPSQLAVRRSSSIDANITWQDHSNNESGFRLERISGFDQPWELIEVLPANVTSYNDVYQDDSLSYLYRVCSINGTLQSNYTEPVDSYNPWLENEEVFYANFDDSQGYQSGQDVHEQNGWISSNGLNARVVSNELPNLGNQLRVGGNGYDGNDPYNSANKVAPYFAQDNSRVRFSAKFSVKGNGDPIDNFGFTFYGIEGEFLFAIDFDAEREEIKYYNDDWAWKDLNRAFSLEFVHDLEIVFNFSDNAWSARFNGQTIAPSAKIANTPASVGSRGMYYVETYYSILDQNNPGSNYMLVDELRLEQFAVDVPDAPTELEVSSLGSDRMLLLWEDGFLVESYHIERTTSGLNDWVEVERIPVDGWGYFYVDTGLSPNSGYDYRVRSQNSFGYSEYTAVAKFQTDHLYQDWLARNDMDRSESMLTNVEGTNYTLLQAYAMGLSSDHFSASSTPQVDVEVDRDLVTLTYYKSRDDLTYVVERRLVEEGQWTSEGVTQSHFTNGRMITTACPVSAAEGSLLRLRINLE